MLERGRAVAGRQEPQRREQARGPQHEVKPAASSQKQCESRAAHLTVKARSAASVSGWAAGLPGVWGAARAQGPVGNRRDLSAPPWSRQGRSYKPMAKSSGAQRESEGVVVPMMGVQQNAPDGKDPCVCPVNCDGPAGARPVRVMTKQPGSWWPAEGETRTSKRHDKGPLGVERVIGPYDEKSCRVVTFHPALQGPSGSRASVGEAKAMDGAKRLDVQHQRTRRRKGNGTITRPVTEQERSVSAPARWPRVATPRRPVEGEAYKQRCEAAERRAKVGRGHIRSVDGEDSTTSPERRASSRARVSSSDGRGIALWAMYPLLSGIKANGLRERWGQRPTPVAERNAADRRSGGEPCEGEPHARFWKRAQETDKPSPWSWDVRTGAETRGICARDLPNGEHRACALLHFGRAGATDTGAGMLRSTGANHPTGTIPSDNVRRPEHQLCAAAERRSGRRPHVPHARRRGDARRGRAAPASRRRACRTRRPSVSRMRENRTSGLKGAQWRRAASRYRATELPVTESALHLAVRHSCWANLKLVAFCERLPTERLEATAPGTYGTIWQTLHLIVGAELGYRWALTEEPPSAPLRPDERILLAELAGHERSVADRCERLLTAPFDASRVVTRAARARRQAWCSRSSSITAAITARRSRRS